jgi:hypothetical protein
LIGARPGRTLFVLSVYKTGVNFQLVEAADDFGGLSDFSNQFCYSFNDWVVGALLARPAAFFVAVLLVRAGSDALQSYRPWRRSLPALSLLILCVVVT